MEKLRVIAVKVSSRFKCAKNYTSLLDYAVAEANKKAKSLYDEYRFINVIPNMTTDSCTMTDYCELTVFLSIPKFKQGALTCKYSRKCECDGEMTLCNYDQNSFFMPYCQYVENPEMCEYFAEKTEGN